MSVKSEEGCVRAAVLTGDGGDGGAPINFIERETIAEGSERPKGIGRRRGKLDGALE
jgi:hypothetical protein